MENGTKLFAHLTKARDNGRACYELRITPSVRPIDGFTLLVPGKREARLKCKEYDAQPWNF